MQLIHSGVLLLASYAAPKNKVAMTLFSVGMIGFSGSIYLLTLDPARFKALGPVTPVGGLCLIGGCKSIELVAFGRFTALYICSDYELRGRSCIHEALAIACSMNLGAMSPLSIKTVIPTNDLLTISLMHVCHTRLSLLSYRHSYSSSWSTI
jgi:hypothetical protein